MASARFAWGIDVGNRALKAVKLVRDGDQLRVDDFELIEHEHVLSNAGDNRESLIQTALANFVQRHPMKGGAVAVGVSGQASFARFIKLPPVEEKKIPEIVRFEAIQQIPFPLDDVEWSYQLFRQPDSPDVEVGIFAMRKELIAKHISYFTDFDMNVQVVQMNPLAVYNAVYYDGLLKGTTMVIDLGAENTDLIICDNDSIWLRSIPIGGNNFTETLVKAFKLPFAKAEDLKRNAATSKYARQIFQAMRPVFADLVAEIQRSVGFYASVHRDSRIKKILALGGTFRLPGLQKYLQQNLSLDVERLDRLGAGVPSDPKLAATFNENLLSVVGAYGLAAQAMGEGKITSSLLPAAIRREKLWKEKTPIFATAAACFCLGTGIALTGYFIQNIKYEAAAADRQKNESIDSQAKALDSEWEQIATSGGNDRAIMKNVLGFLQYRDTWRNLLKEISAAVPMPPGPVAEGLAKNNAEAVKQVARSAREMLVIDAIQSRYVPDMTAILAATTPEFRNFASSDNFQPSTPFAVPGGFGPGAAMGEMGGMGHMGGMAPPPPSDSGAASTGPRGFLITIRGTSPFKGTPTLVEGKFCAALTAIKPTATRKKLEYSVARATLVSAQPLRGNTQRLSELRQNYESIKQAQQQGTSGLGGGGGFAPQGGFEGGGFNPEFPMPGGYQPGGFNPGYNPGFAPGGGGAVGPEEDPAPYKDRLTEEDIRDDWEFTVLVAVIIDPPEFQPPQPQEPTAAAN